MIKTIDRVFKPTHPPTAKWYAEYVLTPGWKDKKKHLRKKRGTMCEDCKKRKSVILHHITYARVLREREADLRLLCGECHGVAHKTHDIPFLYLIYREDFDNKVAPVLRTSRLCGDFTYPQLRVV